MKRKIILGVATLVFAGIGSAKEHDYQTGILVRMDSTACGTAEQGSKTLAGDLLGTDAQHKKTKELYCQEYVLQSEHVVYHLRPKNEKHLLLLPIGEPAEFRVHKDKLVMIMREIDDKEREYVVMSMAPREETRATTSASKN
jgi:hypothetical protein